MTIHALSVPAPSMARPSWLRRVGRVLLAWLATRTLPTAIVLLGWLQRRSAHASVRALARRAGTWPVGAQGVAGFPRHPPGLLRDAGDGRRFGALRDNFRAGVPAAIAVLVVTLPATLAWAVAWHAGWDNSFNKGYEQAGFGPGLGMAGTLLFMLVLAAVPLLLARQALTADWRVWLDLRGALVLLRGAGLGWPLLVGLLAVLLVPVSIARAAPVFAPQVPAFAWLNTASAEDAAWFLRRWHLLWSIGLLAGLLLWRALAARWYAGLLIAAARDAAFVPHQREAQLLTACGLSRTGAGRRFGFWGVLRCTLVGALAVLAGFGFVAQVFVSQFLNYGGVWGWINQPLVMLPVSG